MKQGIFTHAFDIFIENNDVYMYWETLHGRSNIENMFQLELTNYCVSSRKNANKAY